MRQLNDLLRIWTGIMAGLPLLVMLSAVLRWPLAVQFALVMLMFVAAYGPHLVLTRARRRR